MNSQLIEEKINKLPDDLKRQAIDFIDFLLEINESSKNSQSFSFDWEGGLAELGKEYRSVELQHKSMDWR